MIDRCGKRGIESCSRYEVFFHFRDLSQKLPVICLYLSIIGTGAVYYQSRVDGVSHPLFSFIEQTADVSVVSFYSQ